VFADSATGVRMAGAGGALGEISGCMTAVGWLTPGGAFVVRLASGGLQAASAAALAATIRVIDVFMRAPVDVRMRPGGRIHGARALPKTVTRGAAIA
jgi:hypothetical protein